MVTLDTLITVLPAILATAFVSSTIVVLIYHRIWRFSERSVSHTLDNLNERTDNLINENIKIQEELGKISSATNTRFSELEDRIKEQREKLIYLIIIGNTYTIRGMYSHAITYFEQALNVARKVQDRQIEEVNLGNIGISYIYKGNYRRALDYSQKALDLAREIQDPYGESVNLSNLGTSCLKLQKYNEALAFYENALTIARKIHEKHLEEAALGNLAIVYLYLGDLSNSFKSSAMALDVARAVQSRYGEAIHLTNMGSGYNLSGELEKALTHYEEAKTIFEALSLGTLIDYANQLIQNAEVEGTLREKGIIRVAWRFRMPEASALIA